ncbi:transporter, small conductance mechanosensitive ion channel MscS family protein [Veillonella sp. AS16]|nr:mechanosensitive ion channel domain-containing protein [Veillonella sp. AS16]ETS91707.1 transporter, small conductance mechanosensitive ion channel MscS family protein [Veillonella sp. AS16]
MTDVWMTLSSLVFHDESTILHLKDWFFNQAGNILIALIVFLVGRYIIHWIQRVAERVMTRADYDPAAMSFVSQMVYYVLLVGLILICINQLGVPTTNFIAAFGAFGLGIGLALQNNLANLASGLLILLFKPFRAGHYISVGDIEGNVQAIQFMNTIIITKDQKRVYIPNSQMTSQPVTNFSYMRERMIPFVFDISYNNNHHDAIQLLKDIFSADKRILNSKSMEIGIKEFGNNSVRIAAFARVNTSNYLDVFYDIMSDVKDAFDEHGIEIPYPQRVVYMQHVDSSVGESVKMVGKGSDTKSMKKTDDSGK